MLISTKGRYAIRIMLDLARYAVDGCVSLSKIAEREDISLKYLESIAAMLTRAGMIESQRGKEGGYRLTRTPAEYTVGEIIKLAEGSIAPVSCLECETNSCTHASHCLSLPVWVKLEAIVDDYLESITLQDILDRKV